MGILRTLRKMPGIACGAKKGFIVTKRPTKKSARKWYLDAKEGELGRNYRVKAIRGVIRETVGLAPYERRIIEILKGGGSNPQKRAWRFAKNRLGTHIRAQKKVVEMEQIVSSGNRKPGK